MFKERGHTETWVEGGKKKDEKFKPQISQTGRNMKNYFKITWTWGKILSWNNPQIV